MYDDIRPFRQTYETLDSGKVPLHFETFLYSVLGIMEQNNNSLEQPAMSQFKHQLHIVYTKI